MDKIYLPKITIYNGLTLIAGNCFIACVSLNFVNRICFTDKFITLLVLQWKLIS